MLPATPRAHAPAHPRGMSSPEAGPSPASPPPPHCTRVHGAAQRHGPVGLPEERDPRARVTPLWTPRSHSEWNAAPVRSKTRSRAGGSSVAREVPAWHAEVSPNRGTVLSHAQERRPEATLHVASDTGRGGKDAGPREMPGAGVVPSGRWKGCLGAAGAGGGREEPGRAPRQARFLPV